MAVPSKSAHRTDEFPVFVNRQIGSIELSEMGTQSPVSAALALIGADGEEGDYTFTIPRGVLSTSQPPIRFDVSIHTQTLEDD